MAIKSNSQGWPQASDIAVEQALPMVGSASREDGQTVLTNIDTELAKLFADKNTLLAEGGTLTYSTGNSLTTSASLKLHLNATNSSTVITKTFTDTTFSFSSDGMMLYAVLDNRTASTSLSIAGSSLVLATTLPAPSSTNQDVILIAKRIGTVLYFRNGFTLVAGQAASMGQADDFTDSNFSIVDATDNTKQFKVDVAGTTSTSTTLATSQTTNVTVTLPNRTDTLVTLAGSEALSNKSFTTATVVDVTDNTNAALRVTQSGTGDSFVVQDGPGDSTPFRIDANGNVSIKSASNLNLTEALTINGTTRTDVLIADDFAFLDGLAYESESATVTANVLDPFADKVIQRITSASTDLDMIANPTTGRFHILINTSASPILINDNTGATVANRIITGTDGPFTLKVGAAVSVVYDSSNSRWRLTGGAGGGGAGTTDLISASGLAVGDVVYLNGSTYTKANASAANTAEVVGIISRIITANSLYEMTLVGEISGLLAANFVEAALPATGEAIFLSTTDGKMTITEPATVGHVSVPLGVASGSGTMYVAPKRGAVVGSTNARTQVSLSNLTTPQNVLLISSSYEAGTITGWVRISATTSKRFYVAAQFSRNGAGSDWNISYQTSGDTPPTGFSITMTSAGQIQLTLASSTIAGFSSAYINYALNAPAVGATFPLSIDSSKVIYTDIKAANSSGLLFKESDGTTSGSMSDTGSWTLGPSGNSTETHTFNGAYSYFTSQNSKQIITLGNNNNGTNATSGTIGGELAFAIRHNGSLNDVAYIRGTYEGNGTTRLGSLKYVTHNGSGAIISGTTASDGAWTLGPSAGGVSHTINGNLGIGTTAAPICRVDVREVNRTNSSNIGNIGVYTTTTPAIGVGGTLVLGGRFNSATSTEASFASVRGGKENGTDANYAGYLAFQTTVDNSALVERARIDSSGRLLIGTTTSNGDGITLGARTSAGNTSQINFNRFSTATTGTAVEFQNGGTTVGSIAYNSTATAYNTGPSDYRLKENVQNLSGGLEKIQALRPVSFVWKNDGREDIGFIAHEIQAVVPECVMGEKDKVDEEGKELYQSVFPAPAQMIATLVKAIQELKSQLDEAKAQIQELKNSL